MESYLPISFLNDFIFCPRSIYFHQLYGKVSTKLYHSKKQSDGLIAHKSVDEKRYSTAAKVLQSMEVYSSEYGLHGKIDTYDIEKKLISERKKKIKVVYDGYIFQLYAQYFCLVEMGFSVKKIQLYSMDDNKVYPIPIPEKDNIMFDKFKDLLGEIQRFDLDKPFSQNINKCNHCIYNNLCDVKKC